MARKIVIGGLVAGLVMFLWSFLAHEVLPFGETGLQVMPNEDSVMAYLKSNLREDGLYLFPGEDMMRSRKLPKEQQEAAQAEWMKKYQTGPAGLLVFHPDGGSAVGGKTLGIECGSDFLAGFILAFVLWAAGGRVKGFGGRVGVAALLGLMAWLVVDLSYWNWYGYPTSYFFAQAADYVVGTALAGVWLAWSFRKDGQ